MKRIADIYSVTSEHPCITLNVSRTVIYQRPQEKPLQHNIRKNASKLCTRKLQAANLNLKQQQNGTL